MVSKQIYRKKIIDSVANSSCKTTKSYLPLQKSRSDQPTAGSDEQLSSQNDVVQQFVRILLSSPSEMQRALIHLESELSRLCNAETHQVRLDLSLLKAQLRTATVNSHTDPNEIVRIRRQVADTLIIIRGVFKGGAEPARAPPKLSKATAYCRLNSICNCL